MTSPAPRDLPIILLAAGQSRRMRGADKLLEDVGGEPLLRRQAKAARAATKAVVLIALPRAPHPRYTCLEGLDVVPVPVPDAAEGMSASLRRAFAALPDDVPAAMLMLADLPDLLIQDLKTVLEATDFNSGYVIWRGATHDGAAGHPIVFAASLFPDIARLRGDSGARAVVAAAQGRSKLVPLQGQRARRDLDTPEDWAAWRAERGL